MLDCFVSMNLRILYHGNCFDGAASAAFFTKFYRAKIQPEAAFSYAPVMHRAGNAFDRGLLDGDENAIVDFKFCADDRLTWWFDHHESAFLTPEDEAYFRQRHSDKHFLDTTSKSCCEFIARVAAEKYGFKDESLDDLVHWAHVIDGALYESAAECVELRAPALRLMQVIEGVQDPRFLEMIIRRLSEESIAEIVESTEVQKELRPILDQHYKTVDLIKQKANYEHGVVSFDLVDDGLEGFNKFIPYYFYPQTTYTVALTRGEFRTKISVGSNPWAPRERRHNIAKICERYGGGGHAVVGAISLPPDAVEQGRGIIKEIIAELQFED